MSDGSVQVQEATLELELEVELEVELTSEVSVGLGTALFVCGRCFSRRGRIRRLEFVFDGERQPVMAHGMPRLDPFQAGGELPGSYRSGFWGIVRVSGPRPEGVCELSLRAEFDDGRESTPPLGRIRVEAQQAPASVAWPEAASGPRVAICMAAYDPPVDLLRRQLDSIRGQLHDNWVCIISDDCSSPAGTAALKEAVGDDPRFILSRSPRRLGFYRNFERALSLAPRDAQYVAMADQDDVWHPDKLSTLIGEISADHAQLVYSDARVVSRAGAVISETWWNQRRNNHTDLLSLLVANAVTGAASLFGRDLLDYALPFPPAQFAHFHDHWVGLVALALGDVGFVDRPLYDYVQHGAASLGHRAANQMTSLGDRLLQQRSARERVRQWRLHYFVDSCRLLQFATVLEMRCGRRMAPDKSRVLRRFLASDESLTSLATLGVRGARELVGRGRPETLGAEWMLFHAFAWRRLLALSARERPQRRLRLDALPPPSLVMQPGRTGMEESARTVADKIAPLRWAVSDLAPQRINLLIPTIDLKHFFGGYIAKFNLARRLADAGHRVRIVTVDPVGPLPSDWRSTLEAYAGLHGLLQTVEIEFGRESAGIEVSRSDAIIASTWWTAHIAADAVRSIGGERFLYLIQEYEPFTFPMGTYAALAEQSYRFPHRALFSSELLRAYFKAHGIGVYAAGRAAGDEASASFENAITPVEPPTALELQARTTRRLLFYARPEDHAARNMFELGVLALSRALEDGAFGSGWELHGIGTVQRGKRIALGGGRSLELLPRSDQGSYGKLLCEHDVGLALMYTPHPSLVPIEMASAGLVTVTNSFENKTSEALERISTNLIAAEPTVEAVAAGLSAAAVRCRDVVGRLDGSEVRWSSDWRRSFSDEILAWVECALGR